MTCKALLTRKNVLICFLIVTSVFLASILYFRYVKPRKFSDFIELSENNIDSCTIDSIDQKTIVLNGEELSTFITVLNNTHYYPKGKYKNVLIGNLYHIHFISNSNNKKNVILSMIISDKNIAYIKHYQYKTTSQNITIADYISTIY